MRRFGLIALQYGVGIGLLAWLLSTSDVETIIDIMAAGEPLWLGAAVVVFFLAHFINAAKLRILIPELPFSTLYGFTLVGLYYSMVLPGQLGGDAVKAIKMARGAGLARFLSAVFFDKVAGLAALLLVTIVGLLVEFDRFGIVLSVVLLAALGATALAIALPASRRVERFIGRVAASRPQGSRFGRLAQGAARFAEVWRRYSHEPWTLSLSVAAGVVFQLTSIGCVSLIAHGLGLSLSYAVWAVVIGVVSVLVLLPITVAGLGLREATIVGLLGTMGVPAEKGLAISLTFFGFFLLGALAGAVCDPLLGRRGSGTTQNASRRR